MGEKCKQQCERTCQVWQLAVGGESYTNAHLHLPCLPGGGIPGGGLTGRTYEGGCRSSCSGSLRYPVQHFYPAGRIKKWFIDTKEWFWDGMFVMKTKNPTKSASHYCLPFPRPTMRLPRSCNRRLVEVHHVHPPPTAGVMQDEAGDGTRPRSAVESTVPELPLQEFPQQRLTDGSDTIQSRHSGPHESQAPADGAESGNVATVDEPPKVEAEKLTKLRRDKAARISHINVGDGSPQLPAPGEAQFQQGKDGDPPDRTCQFTYIDYGASSLCPRVCRRRFCQGTRVDGAMTTTAVDVKELPNSYVFIADMPGLKHSDTKVQVENDIVLKMSGDRLRQNDFAVATEMEIKYVRVERSPGKFMRKFNLPANTNLDGISAACQDGLLTVTVPKILQHDARRPRSFDVDVRSMSVSPT